MRNVTITDHPLLRHKLTILRDRFTPTALFRQVAREISLLMAYEVMRDLPLQPIDIETPLEPMRTEHLAGKKLCIVSILRAGNGILEGMLDLVPSARVGHIGLYRDPATLRPVEYYLKLPSDIAERQVLLVDPMLATGYSAVAAASRLKLAGVIDEIRLPGGGTGRDRDIHRGPSGRAGVYRGRRPRARRARLYSARPGRCGGPVLRHQMRLAHGGCAADSPPRLISAMPVRAPVYRSAGVLWPRGRAGGVDLADLHDVLVWLVGCPPKAHGMSSWKKCGMSLLKVRRTSSRKSARAGAECMAVNASTRSG